LKFDLISQLQIIGLFSGFFVGTGADISHLLFADDIFAFYGACYYLLFEAVSSSTANLAKSELVPAGNVDNVAGLAWILGCRVASPSLKYLSLPLGASFKAKHIWDSVIEKI
jgi:hypothetical protein